MSDTSINAGLELDDSPALTDQPQNPQLVGYIDSKNDEVKTKEVTCVNEKDPIVTYSDQLDESFETLDGLMDLRSRLLTEKRVNKDLALEALEFNQSLNIRSVKSFTEEMTKVNFEHTLESVGGYISEFTNRVVSEQLKPFTDELKEQTKRLDVELGESFQDKIEGIKSNIEGFIQAYGMNALAEKQIEPEDIQELKDLAGSYAIKCLLDDPNAIKDSILTIDETVRAANEFFIDASGVCTELHNTLKEADTENAIHAGIKLLNIVDNSVSKLESITMFENGHNVRHTAFVERSNALYLNIRSLGTGQPGRTGLELIQGLLDGLKSIWSNSKAIIDESLLTTISDLDVKVALTATVTNYQKAVNLALEQLSDKILFLNKLINYIFRWSEIITKTK